MEVDFTPEQLASLSQIAVYRGTDAALLVKDAALRQIEQDRLFLESVERGIAQSDRGELTDHEEVVAQFYAKYRG